MTVEELIKELVTLPPEAMQMQVVLKSGHVTEVRIDSFLTGEQVVCLDDTLKRVFLLTKELYSQ